MTVLKTRVLSVLRNLNMANKFVGSIVGTCSILSVGRANSYELPRNRLRMKIAQRVVVQVRSPPSGDSLVPDHLLSEALITNFDWVADWSQIPFRRN